MEQKLKGQNSLSNLNYSKMSFEERHPFMVMKEGKFQGRFSNIECAAGNAIYLVSGEVWDEKTGEVWNNYQCRKLM